MAELSLWSLALDYAHGCAVHRHALARNMSLAAIALLCLYACRSRTDCNWSGILYKREIFCIRIEHEPVIRPLLLETGSKLSFESILGIERSRAV